MEDGRVHLPAGMMRLVGTTTQVGSLVILLLNLKAKTGVSGCRLLPTKDTRADIKVATRLLTLTMRIPDTNRKVLEAMEEDPTTGIAKKETMVTEGTTTTITETEDAGTTMTMMILS